jgi:hypothetical protein
MISQQALVQRQRQRRKRQGDHLTIPLEQELSRNLHYEQYLALWALRQPVASAIQAMRYEVYGITDEHCDVIVATFQELLLAVRTCITVLNGPDLPVENSPYPLIMKLGALHRTLIDAQVVVGNVRGQCRCGRLTNDPTGSYWHLRICLRDVERNYQSLLNQLKTVSQPCQSAMA